MLYPFFTAERVAQHFIPILIASIQAGLTVAGWICAYAIALSSQRAQLRNQILNSARSEISAALREQQKWLTEIALAAQSVSFRKELEQSDVATDWNQMAGQMLNFIMQAPDRFEWLLRLEEYELLFPETSTIRRQISEKQQNLIDLLGGLHVALLLGATNAEKFSEALGKAETIVKDAFGIVSLTESLRIHVQNTSLGSIFDRRQPLISPPDPRVPRIVRRRGGQLGIE